MNNIIETNIDNIINNIFLNEPKDVKSIQIIFDNYDNERGLFKQLIEILVKGMKILFSKNNNKINLSNLTDDDFIKLKKYFMSIGFDIYYDINKYPNITNKTNELNSYFFSIKSNNNIYYITFDYL